MDGIAVCFLGQGDLLVEKVVFYVHLGEVATNDLGFMDELEAEFRGALCKIASLANSGASRSGCKFTIVVNAVRQDDNGNNFAIVNDAIRSEKWTIADQSYELRERDITCVRSFRNLNQNALHVEINLETQPQQQQQEQEQQKRMTPVPLPR